MVSTLDNKRTWLCRCYDSHKLLMHKFEYKYKIRAEFYDGRSYTQKWPTNPKEKEEQIIEHATFMYLHGNYSCDCNRLLFICRENGLTEPDDPPCGDNIRLRKLTLIRQDLSEIWIASEGKPQ